MENRLQDIDMEAMQIEHDRGYAMHWSAWLLVWVCTVMLAYLLGQRHEKLRKVTCAVSEGVQTEVEPEAVRGVDPALVSLIDRKYTLEALRLAARQHSCCPGSGTRKQVVIETLLRHHVLTLEGHAAVMARTSGSSQDSRNVVRH